MTGPSSYVFYDIRNPQRERKEGAELIRVFVTEKRVTIFSKQLIRTAKSGVLFEKVLAQTTFSLHENKHGTKYLKRFTKSLGGSFADTSLKALTENFFEQHYVIRCGNLIEKTIFEWFGSGYMKGNLEKVKAKLLFPALQEQVLLPRSDAIFATLLQMQTDYPIVTKALRENNSWSAFIMDVCKPTVKTVEDTALVLAHPEELLPIAIMPLGATLSNLCEQDRETLLQVRHSFMSIDLKLINFMFQNIPSSSRRDALATLFTLIRAHRSRLRVSSAVSHFAYVDDSMEMNRVPQKLRYRLAQEFLKVLNEDCREIESQSINSVKITTQLTNVFRYWFAQVVLEPSMKTALSVEDIETRFLELFGAPLRNAPSPLKFIHKKDTVFCILSASRKSGKYDGYRSDAFTSLKALVKKFPQDKGTGSGYGWLNGYVMSDGAFMMTSGEFYALGDIMKIIEQGAAAVDEHLTKLGRSITPMNRQAFLTFGHKERKFKNTWKFYDWGVTDPERIVALKKARITKKKDVTAFNGLPDEMFHELLALGSDKELSEL